MVSVKLKMIVIGLFDVFSLLKKDSEAFFY